MKHIGRNIVTLVISRIFASIILFLVYTRLIQYLGPEAAGEFGLVGAYLTVFNFFVDLGMQQLVIKKISEDRSQASKYLSNYFIIQFLLGLAFMLLLDVIVWRAHYPPLVKNALYVTGLSLLLSSMTMPLMAVINAFQKLSIIARVNFFNATINGGVMLLAVIWRKDILFLAFAPVFIALFDVIIYAIIVHRKFAKFKFEFDAKFWKQLFIWNTPFMLLTIFSIYNRIDSLILPHLRSFTENGYYTAVYKFWDTLAFLPAVVGAALFPYFAQKLSAGDREESRKVLTIYSRYMIALAVPLTVGAYVLASKITIAFFGPDFAPAAPALWLLVAAVSVLFVYVPVNSIITSQKTKFATIVTGITLLFNLTLNFLLIPKYGFVVAAAVTLASELLQLIGYTYVVQKQILSFTYFRSYLEPLIAGFTMGIAIHFFRDHNLWLVIGFGALVYAVGLVALRFFKREDWELFRSSVNFRKSVEPDNLRGHNQQP